MGHDWNGLLTASISPSLAESEPTDVSTSAEFSADSVARTPPESTPPFESAVPRDGFIQHYEIIRELGEGGMGIVFLGRDTKLGRLVAIKLLHDGGRAASRLLAEAQATASVRHENIVVIYEIGELDGRPYMVLEYLEGQTLRHVLSTKKRGNGRTLPRGLALDIVASVARALAAAHKSGVIHRDLKPENIMLLDSGQVKVLDFGLARRIESTASKPRAGTYAYMAPEQWSGGELDERADIWAVGIVLYEILTGAHPLAPLASEQLEQVADLNGPMPSLRDTYPALTGISDVVDRCLRKRKEERFGSADELLHALEPWLVNDDALTLREGVCPFAGLTAFQELDAGHFFGRERDITTIVGRLDRNALVAVAGPSGAGKSSLVRAGLIPALKRSGEKWDILVVRPGRTPLSALREALAPDEVDGDLGSHPALFGALLRARCRARSDMHRVLIFVDQFEELFTQVPDASERAAFFACLLGAADDASSPLRVVLSIRSDFLDRLVEDRHFMAQVSAGLFFLPPVDLQGLREALVRPAELAGYGFESEAMVADMLSELGRARSPLPLLQFSATALWEARDIERKLLTQESYDRIGGVAGALSTHADAVVSALSTSDQRLCRAIFMRLVTPERTRAIVNLCELAELGADAGAVEAVVQHLASARLLLVDTSGEVGTAKVELVHESMIERWPTLSRWLNESAGDATFLAHLRTAASQWEASGESVGMLWRDRTADEARAFYKRYRDERGEILHALEERYLLAVMAFAERARQRRQRQITGAFALVSAVAILVIFLALRARAQAMRADDLAIRAAEDAAHVRKQNADLAREALRGRNATRLLAAHRSEEDPTLVFALLREFEPEPEGIAKGWSELMSAALSAGVARDVWITDRPYHPSYAAVMSPDGTRIATAQDDHTARILGQDLVQRACLRGHEKAVWAVAWSADAKRVVTASFDNTARIWNADGSGEPIVLRGHGDALISAMMSPDGQRVVTASDDKTARVWSAVDGREILVLRHDSPVQYASWSPDGKRIVTAAASVDGIARVWHANGKGTPLLLRGHTDMVVAATFHPDGTRIATASRDRTARVWNAVDGTELVVLRGHDEKVMSVAYSPDGERIATASKDKTARIWRADGKGDPIVLRGHKHWVYTATWSPDGREIITTSLDSTHRRFKLDEIVAPTFLRGHADNIRGLVFSPDGKRVATASFDGTARVWSVDGGGELAVLRGHSAAVNFLRWSPDGKRIVTLSEDDRTGRIWTLDGSAAPVVLEDPTSHFQTLDWSPGNERLVTASRDGTLRLWSKDGIELSSVKKTTSDEYKWIWAIFEPSGKRILVSDTSDDTVYFWNISERAELVPLGRHETTVKYAKWSPDGSRILMITSNGMGRLWSVSGATVSVEIRGRKAIRNGFWSPDGRRLFIVQEDGTISLWNGSGLDEPRIMGIPEEGSAHAGMSADGKRFLTSTQDGKVQVRNADGTGVPFVVVTGAALPPTASWSPASNHIAVHYEEKFARIWSNVRLFEGLDDARLWTATSICIPPEIRVQLLGVTEEAARASEEACRRHVANARQRYVEDLGSRRMPKP